MAEVKRTYDTTLRDRHAAITRTAVLDAASQMFLADGYASTSIKKVAEVAGVSEKTVYNNFTDKPTLLFEVGNRVLSSTHPSDGATEPDLASRLEPETDPLQRVKVISAWSRMLWEQGMLQFESMLFDAAATDPRIAEVAENAMQQKYEDTRRDFLLVFPDYADRGDLDDAVDLTFAITTAAFTRTLIQDRGWSWDKYEQWLATMLTRLFLHPG